MRATFFFSITIVMCLGLGIPASAFAYCRLTTSSANGQLECQSGPGQAVLEWKSRCVTYSIDERGALGMDRTTLENTIQSSFREWLRVRCDGEPIQMNVVMDQRASRCDRQQFRVCRGNVNTIAFVNDWIDLGYDSRTFALTFHHFSTEESTDPGKVFDADMLFNQRHYRWINCGEACDPAPPVCDACATVTSPTAQAECRAEKDCQLDRIDLRNVATHEAGHFFGLAHTVSDLSATMFASTSVDDISRRTLEEDDKLGMCSIFPQGRASATCDDTPTGGLDLNCEDDDGKLLCADFEWCSASRTSDSAPEILLFAIGVLGIATRRRLLS